MSHPGSNQYESVIVVCCAIIRDNENIMIARKQHGSLESKWEFPGGKTEPGETRVNCLHRELKEELNITVEITQELPPVKYHYPDKSILLFPFVCVSKNEVIKLTDHEEVRWVKIDEIEKFDLLGADRVVIEKYLKRIFL